MKEQLKNQIDSMSYKEMFAKIRFAPIGDPMFLGEQGDYFMKVYKEKQSQVTEEDRVRTSKEIGWE